MFGVETLEDGFIAAFEHEKIQVQAWGSDALRVRIRRRGAQVVDRGALETQPKIDVPVSVDVSPQADAIELTYGHIGARLTVDNSAGIVRPHIQFTRDGNVFLQENAEHFLWPGGHGFFPRAGAVETHQVFASSDDEKLFGLGQYAHGRLDNKGLVLDLVQRNGIVSIPFMLSNKGYGFLWNNPAVGRVELAANQVRWVSNDCEWIDYWVCARPTPKQILESYTAVTGRAPVMPQWATGFWQSKLRYTSQEELLEVARTYHREGIPLSVIVSDFFHWTAMGDYQFDPVEFPDPAAMVQELEAMGTKLMVSIWPTVSKLSKNYEEMRQKGYLVGTDAGVEFHQQIQDKGMSCAMPNAFYDATNPDARAFLWEQVKKGYHDHGIDVFWLDACEPEVIPCQPENLRFDSGRGAHVFNSYPRDHAKGFADGLNKEDNPTTVMLSRSAWVGQAQYGTAVWSGDIAPTWQALKEQVPAGLNISVAGIPWWTSDIGGFHGGDPNDPAYQELFIRWFEYGTFCPLFRLHGHREPREAVGSVNTGGPNEIWSYGDAAFNVARQHIQLREQLRPYIDQQMAQAARTGCPPMRPLFLNYPEDPGSWDELPQFMLGPDLLICPVTEPGVTELSVYLPAGERWLDIATKQVHEGGQRVLVPAPLERIPLFIRQNAELTLSLDDTH